MSALSSSQQPTVLFSIYQNNTWTISLLVNETIESATQCIILKIVGFQDFSLFILLHGPCQHMHGISQHCHHVIANDTAATAAVVIAETYASQATPILRPYITQTKQLTVHCGQIQ